MVRSVALLAMALAMAGMTPVVTPKKGVGHWGDRLPNAPDVLGCSWYYNWGPRPETEPGGVKAEFVPMIWSGAFATAENLAHVTSAGYTALLGFTEDGAEDGVRA
ncbi:MAG: glycosyl hydrolase [Candidatus Coatesbacteria bacterium]